MREPLVGKRLVVLLPSALRDLRLHDVKDRGRALPGRLVICFSAEGGAAALRQFDWHVAGFPLKSVESIAALVGELCGRLQRPVVPPATWLPCAPLPGTDAARIAEAIPWLELLQAQELARALGIGERKLRRLCLATFCVPTKKLLQHYLVAVAGALSPELRSDEEAQALGYADASTFERAVRDANVALRGSRTRVDSAQALSASALDDPLERA
jgi:AraC-like DNA-binding protein